MSIPTPGPVLVTGATGMQGGMTAQALLCLNFKVRALVRDPTSKAAVDLQASGVELVQGDLTDRASLDRAVKDAYGVFSVQAPSAEDDSEQKMGVSLVDAAYAAGVKVFVHTSVARAGDQEEFVGWQAGKWSKPYWENKSAIIDAVVAKGFDRYTILKPAWFMDNFAIPRSLFMLPELKEKGLIQSGVLPEVKLDFIAARDIGRFAAAAFQDPDKFHQQHVALASEALTLDQVAQKLQEATGKSVQTRYLSADEMKASGMHPGLASSWEWINEEGYRVDIVKTKSWGVEMLDFAEWAKANKDLIVIG